MAFTSSPEPARIEPVDVTSATWAAAIDWVAIGLLIPVGAVVGYLLAMAVAPATGAVLVLLMVMSALYGWSVFRALRLRAGAAPLAEQAAAGELSVRVIDRGRAGIAPIFALRPTVLKIGLGTVELGDERWPAAAVTVTKRPNLWFSRGIGLSTPSGPRFVSVLPKLDPAIWASAIVDQEAVASLERVLATNAAVQAGWPRLPPMLDVASQGAVAAAVAPGWYADPWQPGGWRWWDGTRWSEHRR